MPAGDRSHQKLEEEIRACAICDGLPLGPKPIFQFNPRSRILIAGQAPGRLTHAKGIPFDDPSGNRLRDWLGVNRDAFYDPSLFALVPMGFCFPGTGKGGDLPPRSECAQAWREKVLGTLTNVQLTLVIGQYAHNWHLGEKRDKTLAKTVGNWRDHWPELLPLPHPSPRNIRWFRNHPWFEADILPVLKARVQEILAA